MVEKTMTRRTAIGVIGGAVASGAVLVSVGNLAGCGDGFQEVGGELVAHGRVSVYTLTEQEFGTIVFVPRSSAGDGVRVEGPQITEIRTYDAGHQKAPGEWVFEVNGQQVDSDGAQWFTLLPGQRVQWLWRPFQGDAPQSEGMPEREWNRLRAIGARNAG